MRASTLFFVLPRSRPVESPIVWRAYRNSAQIDLLTFQVPPTDLHSTRPAWSQMVLPMLRLLQAT
jgi:hypothetical protein